MWQADHVHRCSCFGNCAGLFITTSRNPWQYEMSTSEASAHTQFHESTSAEIKDLVLFIYLFPTSHMVSAAVVTVLFWPETDLPFSLICKAVSLHPTPVQLIASCALDGSWWAVDVLVKASSAACQHRVASASLDQPPLQSR